MLPIAHAHHNAQCTVEYPACTSSKKATVRARPAKLPAIVDAHAGREWKAWCAAVGQSSLIFGGESTRGIAPRCSLHPNCCRLVDGVVVVFSERTWEPGTSKWMEQGLDMLPRATYVR